MNKTTVLVYNGHEIHSYNHEWFPTVNVGETLQFEEAYPEATVQRGLYIVESISHVITKHSKGVHVYTNVKTIIKLKTHE
jgi:hypothetical protein